MTARVGLGIGRDSVRAVLVRGGKIVWSTETAVTEDVDLRAALEQTLQSLPRKRGWRRSAVAAIGPSLTQLKSLALPPASNDRLLGEAVSANVGRFFLRNGVPLRVSMLRREGKDRAWIGAIEAPIADVVEEVCHKARLRYQGAVPLLAVLPHAVASSAEPLTITWRDHDVSGEVGVENGRLVRAARSSPDERQATEPKAVDALKVLNGSGWRLADAYAGAVADPKDPLVLRPIADAVRKRRRRTISRVMLAALCIGLALVALFAPGLIAARVQNDAAQRLAQLAPRQREVASAQQALSKATRALQRGADFANDRLKMTELLASITGKLPAMTAVLNFRVDSAGGNLVALSPNGADVFAAIGLLPQVTGARITAPLTRETVESAELERVAMRFQFVRSRAPAPRNAARR